ncbi:transmembrane transport protein [Streptomyces sp. NRRL F-4489]|uniref:transmembrane transport protein n=1 Tax=Streptomyces sp. NRRL F-4489 TaxID=1609095 RepID=UPI0007487FE8|nr:transmembrane transport protein [Streptomyces sp. NRRL F-4489]KUL47753.1 transmembrane transport protein [Streptomyces sp. NRRL F-4489]
MTTATTPEAGTGRAPAGSGALHGTLWLVWRRHRTALLAGVLATLAACAVFSYQRIGLMGFLGGHDAGADALADEFRTRFGSDFQGDIGFLQYVPVVVAVFLGAPLIASELERGTVHLVTTQSVGRGRWLATTLALPLTLVTACTTLLALVFQWLWTPARSLVVGGDWLNSGPFEVTGPVLAAKTLFLTACGIALGKLIKRVVPAMLATAFTAAAVSVVWGEKIVPLLGTPRRLVYPYDGDGPRLPSDAVNFDDWVATADGRLYGFGTCVHDANPDACRAKLGIVNHVTEYFSYDQMAGMQWRAAGILLALAAAVLAFVVWRARRRPL